MEAHGSGGGGGGRGGRIEGAIKWREKNGSGSEKTDNKTDKLFLCLGAGTLHLLDQNQ